jgi:hypothetical protein
VNNGIVPEHPNQYFDESRKYLSGEIEKPKAALPPVPVQKDSAPTSQNSVAVDDAADDMVRRRE